MQLPKFFGKQNRPKLIVRRIVGSSMSPKLVPGQLVLASGMFKTVHKGSVYVFRHDGKEKIKRVERVSGDRVFFIGDNLDYSSDSRHFGWIFKKEVRAKVLWPRIHN